MDERDLSRALHVIGSEAKLTSFGEKVLAGGANHVEMNGIDDWIGGVHLGDEGPVTFRKDDTLILPP